MATLLSRILKKLEKHYGPLAAPEATDPFEQLLWENVAYLMTDERRKECFYELRRRVGLRPKRILEAPRATLLEIAIRGGMRPEDRVDRWRIIASIVMGEFQGDLSQVLKLPLTKARKALMKFPSIGAPGADKILLFSGAQAIPALESNGLRVLLRIGFGEQSKNYSATYRSVQKAIDGQAVTTAPELVRMHQVLRTHGKQICRNNDPACPECPARADCRYARDRE